MEIVECPHCATRVSNDGSLSAMVVACPGCAGLFQMPALSPAPAPSPVSGHVPEPHAGPGVEANGEPFGHSDSTEQEAPARRQEPKGPPLWLAVIGSTALFWAVVFILLAATRFTLFSHSGPKKKPIKREPPKPKVERRLADPPSRPER
jgi:hypothetical protein